MPYGGGEIEVKVEANVSFDVKPSVDWIHYVETKALSSSTVRLTVDENETYSAREGKIEIAQQNGSIKHSITVKQAGRIAVTSIELDKASLSLKPEETAILIATVKPDNATDKTIIWSSSDSEIVSVDDTGTVTAVKDGSAIITAQAGEKSAICNVTVTASVYFGNAVDLGIYLARDGTLYKLLWADCNLGTDTPEGYGDYYAWGETETKADYTWSSYLWGKEWNKMTKYCPTDKASYWDGDGSPDGKKVLDPVDDVAHEKLGGKWRIPTRTEQDALRSQCVWTWTKKNGANGYEVKSKVNMNSIFLPAAGNRDGTGLSDAETYGGYWASSHYTEYPGYAYGIFFSSDYLNWSPNGRYGGLSVRPVTE